MKITRNIQVPGDALLPPSATPIPPEGIPPNEGWNVIPPVDPIYTEQTHFVFHGYGMNSQLAEAKRFNEPDLFGRHYGSGKGVQGLPSPTWRITPSTKPLPDAWEGSGCFYLSRRLVEALEELAPAAIDKVPMRIEDISGNLVSDNYFVADVVAHYAAIDWANSQVLYARIGNNPPVPSPSFTRMIPDLPKSLVVFRDNVKRSSVYITRDAKDVLGRMKPKLRGVEFGGA